MAASSYKTGTSEAAASKELDESSVAYQPAHYDLSNEMGRGPSDVQIMCVGGTVKVHREVMSNASAYLKEVFKTPATDVVLYKYCTVQGMWVVVSFIYYGKMPLALSEDFNAFQEACKIAYYCGLREIFKIVWKIYTEQHLNMQTCVVMWTMANDFDEPASKIKPMSFLIDNFAKLNDVVNVTFLTKSQLHELIVEFEPSVSVEDLVSLIILWLDIKPPIERRLTDSFELLKLLHLNEMSPPMRYVELQYKIDSLVRLLYDDTRAPMLPFCLDKFGDVAFRVPQNK